MVLQGKLCGRVGRRRELFQSPEPVAAGSGLFLFLVLSGRAREHHLTVSPDLRTLFELEPHPGADALETFITDRLYEAGAWSTEQCPDGIVHIRVLEAQIDRLSLCGRLVEINGKLHPFWLELERSQSGTALTWALYVDVVAATPRRARDAIDLFDSRQRHHLERVPGRKGRGARRNAGARHLTGSAGAVRSTTAIWPSS